MGIRNSSLCCGWFDLWGGDIILVDLVLLLTRFKVLHDDVEKKVNWLLGQLQPGLGVTAVVLITTTTTALGRICLKIAQPFVLLANLIHILGKLRVVRYLGWYLKFFMGYICEKVFRCAQGIKIHFLILNSSFTNALALFTIDVDVIY